jgi:phosphoglycolate phosphatase-like HAD superfamily hydrolase
MNKVAIIFDWDGTLFNSMEYKMRNMIKIFTELSVSEFEAVQLYRKLSGVPREKLFKAMFDKLLGRRMTDGEYIHLSNTFTNLNIESSLHAKLFNDVIPAIKKLKILFCLFISSSSDHKELISVVKSNQIEEYFEGVFGSKQGFNKGQDHFQHIMEKYLLKLQDLLFVGDDDQDMLIGKECGVDTVRIIREGLILKNNDHPYITKLSDLVLLLKKV